MILNSPSNKALASSPANKAPSRVYEIDLATWNALPATARRTVSDRHYALVDGRWREVEIVRPLLSMQAVCLPIPGGRTPRRERRID
jgi:hypothetical protein